MELLAEANNLEFYRREFAAKNFFQIKGFISSPLEKFITASLSNSTFSSVRYKVGQDETAYGGVQQVLPFLLKSSGLFSFFSSVTGKRLVDGFGRTFRLSPSNAGYSWHTDASHGRILGVSICLSPMPYSGGCFVLRNQSRGIEALEIPNVSFGDALVFGIGEGWEHMVTPMTGEHPKTTHIFWYCETPAGDFAQENIYDN